MTTNRTRERDAMQFIVSGFKSADGDRPIHSFETPSRANASKTFRMLCARKQYASVTLDTWNAQGDHVGTRCRMTMGDAS